MPGLRLWPRAGIEKCVLLIGLTIVSIGTSLPELATSVMVACIPIFFSGYRISRGEGALLATYDLTYTLYLVLSAVRDPTLPVLSVGLL